MLTQGTLTRVINMVTITITNMQTVVIMEKIEIKTIMFMDILIQVTLVITTLLITMEIFMALGLTRSDLNVLPGRLRCLVDDDEVKVPHSKAALTICGVINQPISLRSAVGNVEAVLTLLALKTSIAPVFSRARLNHECCAVALQAVLHHGAITPQAGWICTSRSCTATQATRPSRQSARLITVRRRALAWAASTARRRCAL
jgi:hypothetical protein